MKKSKYKKPGSGQPRDVLHLLGMAQKEYRVLRFAGFIPFGEGH